MLKKTTVSWLLAMFSATFAPAGTGKLPTWPLTWIMRPAAARLAEAEAEAEAEDPLRLGAAGLVVAVLAVVIPAVHAASDRLAAQAARATAAGRYLFMGFLRRCLSHSRCRARRHSAKPRRAPCQAYREFVAGLQHRARSWHGHTPLPGRGGPDGACRDEAAASPARSASLV